MAKPPGLNPFRRAHEKRILCGVDVRFSKGSFTAVMGASGAGKTTLLNALCGRAIGHRLTGEVLCDPAETSFAFVIQDDIMLQTLTPRQILWFSVQLGMGDANRRKGRVDELLDTFRLNGCADTIVGVPGEKRGISGGERKRVSIAMSLVSDPSIIFIDEPTSGLDSSAAFNVVGILRSLADAGKTIVCCIHQPSEQLLALFTHVLIMAQGRPAFYGPRAHIDRHFAAIGLRHPRNVNTASWLIDLVDTSFDPVEIAVTPADSAGNSKASTAAVSPMSTQVTRRKGKKQEDSETSGEYEGYQLDVVEVPSVTSKGEEKQLPPVHTTEFVDHIIAAYAESPLGRANAEAITTASSSAGLIPFDHVKRPYARRHPVQIGLLMLRSGLSLLHDRPFLISRLMQTVVVAALIAILFNNMKKNQAGIRNRLGFMFFCCMVQMLFALLSVLFVIPRDFAVMLREHLNGLYRVTAYLPSMIVVDMPLQIIFPCLFGVIVYWSCGLNMQTAHAPFIFFCMLILLANLGAAMGFFLSAATGSLSSSLQLAPAVFIPNVMFSGFVLDLATVTWVLRWAQYVTFLKYSFAVLAYNELHDLTFSCGDLAEAQCQFKTGMDVLAYYQLDNTNIRNYFLILLGMLVFLRVAAVAAMVLSTRKYRARKTPVKSGCFYRLTHACGHHGKDEEKKENGEADSKEATTEVVATAAQ
eukprot:TRINITY_DN5391_c0_g1_i1.p1 TRINITY_DN5391_c0_g1~~TRINITY_DN5391_c0_g1_i1.p1  ORF type:complete len:698 (-),score=198.40 TRINITY_DN5391_c0_g1_i1:82-2175(-)